MRDTTETFECINVQQAQDRLAQGAPLHLTNSNLSDLVAGADHSLPVLVMCYHGNSSKGAAQFLLLGQGFSAAYSIDGGFDAWRAAFPQQVAHGSE
ncbi:thiosulfate sulfurtransferase [Pantoea sp. Eser]|nr:thiosulfate sulfurtransferase [Pantoea sp. Eser]